MSTIKTTNITHGSNSGTNNLILDNTGKVSIAEKKLYCPGTIIQVKNIHFVGVADYSLAAQQSSQSWWEYDNANLRLGITPTSTDSKILVIGHVSVGATTSTHLSVRLYRRLASGTGATIGQNTATNGTCRLAISMMHIDQTNATYTMPVNFYDTPANTSDEHVYYYAFTHNSSSTRTIGVNRSGDDTNNSDHTRATSGITLMEVAG
tara:strand:- start:255 stop:875 length:621 start_codon:yes stop_codon:yes gene_type:complete